MKTLPAHKNYTDSVFRDGFELMLKNKAQAKGTVLLIHGLTGTPSEMEGLANFLYNNGFNCVVPKLTGHSGNFNELKTTLTKTWLLDAQSGFQKAYQVDPQKPLFVAGLSFGALLSLYLGIHHSKDISGLVVVSAPFKLRSLFKEIVSTVLSFFPERLLNYLGCVHKTSRPEGYLKFKHNAYPVYSIGAVARLVKIRRMIKKESHCIKSSVLIVQDQADHHVSPDSALLLKEYLSAAHCEIKYFPEGQHELLLGNQYKNVFDAILTFFQSQYAA